MPEELSRNRFDVILQHDWSMEQCLLHIRVFFGGKMKSPWFVLFIHWLIKQITLTESIFQGHTKIALCKGNPLTLESEGLGNPEWIILYSTRSVYFRKLTTRYSYGFTDSNPNLLRIALPSVLMQFNVDS